MAAAQAQRAAQGASPRLLSSCPSDVATCTHRRCRVSSHVCTCKSWLTRLADSEAHDAMAGCSAGLIPALHRSCSASRCLCAHACHRAQIELKTQYPFACCGSSAAVLPVYYSCGTQRVHIAAGGGRWAPPSQLVTQHREGRGQWGGGAWQLAKGAPRASKACEQRRIVGLGGRGTGPGGLMVGGGSYNPGAAGRGPGRGVASCRRPRQVGPRAASGRG